MTDHREYIAHFIKKAVIEGAAGFIGEVRSFLKREGFLP